MAMTFQLKDFDGPLDLLLFLINKEKIDIKDIFVSQITDQYIDSVRNAPDLDMDDATDFLVMAATLLEIKSRAMLPRPPRIEEGEAHDGDTVMENGSMMVYCYAASYTGGIQAVRFRRMTVQDYTPQKDGSTFTPTD